MLLRCNDELTLEGLERAREKRIKEIHFIHIDEDRANTSIRDTLLTDHLETKEEAIIEIYRRLRPAIHPRRKRQMPFSEVSFLNRKVMIFQTWGGPR